MKLTLITCGKCGGIFAANLVQQDFPCAIYCPYCQSEIIGYSREVETHERKHQDI